MRINHNIGALNTYRQLSANSANTNKALEKLSSGLRINKAADDAAGLAISEKMRGQIRGLNQASSNAQDSISMIQTAEGALNETHSILQRMRELSVQASNDTSTDTDRAELQKEVSQLKSEVDRISSTTEFNTKKLLNGSLSGAKALQGSVEASSKFNVADTLGTSGSVTAGTNMAVTTASAGATGTGAASTAGAALADRTIIQTGVNDKFNITINGKAYADVTIATSSSTGYTKQEFVDALNAAVKNKVGTDSASQFNQATFQLGTDGRLSVTTAAAGSDPSINVTLANPTTGGAAASALAAMGYAQKETTITSTKDLSGGFTVATGAVDLQFAVKIGNGSAGTAVNIDLSTDASATTKLSSTAGSNYTFQQVKDALQSALDNKLGKGAVSIGDDGSGHIVLNNNVGATNFQLAPSSAAGAVGENSIFGFTAASTTTAASVLQASNVTTNGTDSVNVVKAGTVISAGSNDQLSISVDGGSAKTITLSAGTYATQKDLVTEVNNQINADKDLVGKVKAQLDKSGSKVEFVSSSTGTTSNVVVDDPTVKAQSALGSLGYTGFASQLTQTVGSAVDIKAGVDLTTAANRKFDVTLGNKTVTIDLSNEPGINTDSTLTTKTSSGDAILKGIQDQLNKAFGDNAITVSTTATDAGEQNLVLTANARSSALKVANGANNGATTLFGGAQTATVSATIANTSVAGTDTVHNTLDTNTKLTDLTDVDGNKLGLSAGNVINISGTQDGNAFATSITVSDKSTVSDVMNSLRNLDAFKGATVSLDAQNGKFIIKGADGADKDISNLSFSAQNSATDTTAVASFNTMFGKFNETQKAQNASSDNSLTMQIGANQGQTLKVDINDMGTQALRIQDVDVSTAKGAQTAVSVVDNAIQTVSSERAKLGAYQNRLEHTINNLGTSSENLTSSESRIRDVDMASQMMEFTKNNILSQAAQSMLAQANQQPQGVLQLLR